MAKRKITYDVECLLGGLWFWCLPPDNPHKTREAAQAEADRLTAEHGKPHRVRED